MEGINKEQLTWKINLEKRYANVCRKTYDRTINFDNTMSAADMQALIDPLHRNIPTNHQLIIQFEDGNYTVDAALLFSGFYGGGDLIIQGNRGDGNILYTAQSVYLDFNNSTHAIQIQNCDVRIYIYNLKIRTVTTSSNYCPVYIINCPEATVCYNYLLGTNTANGSGLFITRGSHSYANSNYVATILYGLRESYNSHMASYNNDDVGGSSPAYGLYAEYGGAIGKRGTQPAGGTANELTNYGGVIR